MFLSPLFYALFHVLNQSLRNRSLAVNYVSFFNSNVAIALSTASVLQILPYGWLQLWLTSYFFYDALVLLRRPGSFRVVDGAFMLHHALSITTLMQTQYASIISRLMLTVEVSNWPMYIVKHYIENSDSARLALWRRIQFFTYVPLRVVAVGTFFFVRDALFLKVIGAPVYLMGLVWSYKLYKNM